jgi:Na+-transporting methylmalonyl-CoA/oxaloacetate decarboxylase gamma subunit
MSALVKYYAFMVLVFVVILIYNIAFYSTFQTFKCPVVKDSANSTKAKKNTKANATRVLEDPMDNQSPEPVF